MSHLDLPELADARIAVRDARLLILGFAVKENYADLHNTHVAGLVREFKGLGMAVTVVDPWVDAEEALAEYGVTVLAEASAEEIWDAAVLAVSHRCFTDAIDGISGEFSGNASIVFDIKSALSPKQNVVRL